jgi:hypothetical protein
MVSTLSRHGTGKAHKSVRSFKESRMQEICPYGLTRERGSVPSLEVKRKTGWSQAVTEVNLLSSENTRECRPYPVNKGEDHASHNEGQDMWETHRSPRRWHDPNGLVAQLGRSHFLLMRSGWRSTCKR